MSHTRSLSTPNATPKSAKRQGMVFTRPFTWAECPSPRESPLYFSAASSHSRTSSAPSSSTSAPSTVSPRSASPSGSYTTSPRVRRTPSSLDTRTLPPSIITFTPSASIPRRTPLPRASCGENASEPKRPCGLPHPFSAAALSPPQPHPFSAAAIACHARNTYPREVSGRPAFTASAASTASSISSIYSTYSGFSHLSHPSASSPSPHLDDPPAPLLPLPTLTDLAMVARTPFLELGISPSLVIRPIVPCERCALHGKECVYDPAELRRNWVDGGTLPLPACSGCPDEEGCWHVLAGRMVRPRAVVFESPRVVELGESWCE